MGSYEDLHRYVYVSHIWLLTTYFMYYFIGKHHLQVSQSGSKKSEIPLPLLFTEYGIRVVKRLKGGMRREVER